MDYLPISILSGVYKILGKVLAIRLKGVLPDLISNLQCGGLPSRQIHKGVLVANELLDSRIKAKEPGVLFKLDFTKAFDIVSWSFLDKLLDKYRFGSK